MAVLFEGECVGKVVNPEVGLDSQNRPRVRWDMIVADGDHKGKRANYSGKLDPENIKFTKRDMVSVGWAGKDVRTFVDDVKKADRAVPFTAEIASFKRDDGSVSEWTSAKFNGGSKPLGQMDRDGFDKVNRWFSEAGDVSPPSGTDPIPF